MVRAGVSYALGRGFNSLLRHSSAHSRVRSIERCTHPKRSASKLNGQRIKRACSAHSVCAIAIKLVNPALT